MSVWYDPSIDFRQPVVWSLTSNRWIQADDERPQPLVLLTDDNPHPEDAESEEAFAARLLGTAEDVVEEAPPEPEEEEDDD